MEKINLNTEVIIYPNERGWKKMIECYYNHYNIGGHHIVTWKQAGDYIRSKRTEDDGFKEQLWEIMATYHDMFFNGTSYWKHTNLTIVPDPYDLFMKEYNKPKNKIKRWLKIRSK